MRFFPSSPSQNAFTFASALNFAKASLRNTLRNTVGGGGPLSLKLQRTQEKLKIQIGVY